MTNNKPIDNIVIDLKERAKELSCLYAVQELFRKLDEDIAVICQGLVNVLPPGWQYHRNLCCKSGIQRS